MDFKGWFLLLKNFRTTGALAPSSPLVIKRWMEDMDFSGPKVIVELGPGSGCVTKRILDQMDKESHLYSFEINKVFFDLVSEIKDPRLTVINESAEFVEKHLKSAGVEKIDYIISALPLAIMPPEVNKRILKAASGVLKEDGEFSQIQYSLRSYKLIKEAFGEVQLKYIILNFPPAFIYFCKKA